MNKIDSESGIFFLMGTQTLLSSINYIFSYSTYIEGKKLYFKSNNIQPLSAWLFNHPFNEDLLSKLINDIVSQIEFLELNEKAIIGFNLDEIYVVDDKHFFLFPNLSLIPILDDTITIKFPFSKPLICCPEIISSTSLPIQSNVNATKFMVGQLCIFCFYKVNILRGNELMEISKIEEVISSIKYSNIYWFIMKSISTEAKNRQLLYVE